MIVKCMNCGYIFASTVDSIYTPNLCGDCAAWMKKRQERDLSGGMGELIGYHQTAHNDLNSWGDE